MLGNMKKKYLSRMVFLWSFCAVLFSVPLLICSIKYGKWLVGVLGTLSVFAVAAILVLISKLRLTNLENSVHSQEKRYAVTFSDEEIERLSNNGTVYLSKNWLINLPNWALFKEHITKITYEKFDNLKTDEKYCCFIHTVDNVNYTVWVANSESAKKLDAWLWMTPEG